MCFVCINRTIPVLKTFAQYFGIGDSRSVSPEYWISKNESAGRISFCFSVCPCVYVCGLLILGFGRLYSISIR